MLLALPRRVARSRAPSGPAPSPSWLDGAATKTRSPAAPDMWSARAPGPTRCPPCPTCSALSPYSVSACSTFRSARRAACSPCAATSTWPPRSVRRSNRIRVGHQPRHQPPRQPVQHRRLRRRIRSGNVVGVTVEGWLGIGYQTVHVISAEASLEIVEQSREAGFGVTTFTGQGRNGPVVMLLVMVRRKRVQQLLNTVRAIDRVPSSRWRSCAARCTAICRRPNASRPATVDATGEHVANGGSDITPHALETPRVGHQPLVQLQLEPDVALRKGAPECGRVTVRGSPVRVVASHHERTRSERTLKRERPLSLGNPCGSYSSPTSALRRWPRRTGVNECTLRCTTYLPAARCHIMARCTLSRNGR